MCVSCRRRAPQEALLRLGTGPEGVIDLALRPRQGRGAYVCPQWRCLQKAVQKGAMGRALRSAATPPPPQEIARRARAILERRLARLDADPGAAESRAPLRALLAALGEVPDPGEPRDPGSRLPVDAASGASKVSHRAQTERRKGGPASAHG